MSFLKVLSIACTVIGALAGCAGEFIDKKEKEEFIKEEVAKQVKEAQESN